MGFFGAPIGCDDHSARAIEAAIDIVAEVEKQKVLWAEQKLPKLDVRVGIANGNAIVSRFGSAKVSAYAAIGPCVNHAARVCSLAGPGQVRLLEPVFERAKEHPRGLKERDVKIYADDQASLKGFDGPISIYGVRT